MTTEDRRQFGRYLARLRGDRSQRAFAAILCELAGTDSITRHEISRWERGERIPDAWLPHLSRALGVPLLVLEHAAARARGTTTASAGAPVDLTAFFPEGGPFPTLLHHAWHGRTAAKAAGNPDLVLVGGYAGSGKTEFARFLSDLTGWTILDKDAITRRMTERLLVSLGGDAHDRHTGLYLDEVRPLEYKCLLSAARSNIDSGVSLILAAPFVEELNDRPWLTRLTHQCNAQGVDVTTIWVRADPDTMHDYMEQRDAPRDAWKLSNWDEYLDALDTEDSPETTHITIDNRHGAAVSLAEQTRRALQKITV